MGGATAAPQQASQQRQAPSNSSNGSGKLNPSASQQRSSYASLAGGHGPTPNYTQSQIAQQRAHQLQQQQQMIQQRNMRQQQQQRQSTPRNDASLPQPPRLEQHTRQRQPSLSGNSNSNSNGRTPQRGGKSLGLPTITAAAAANNSNSH